MSRAQLQLHRWAPSSASVEQFFGVELPAQLEKVADRCRATGGRYGFRVGAEQWLVDLAWVRVTGGGDRAVLEEADALDVVVSVSSASLQALLEGKAPVADMVISQGTPEALAPLLALLGGGR